VELTSLTAKHPRARLIVVLAILMVGSMFVLANGPAAHAAVANGPRVVRTKTEKIKYDRYWVFKAHRQGVCVKLTVKGNITFKLTITLGEKNYTYNWTDITLNDPNLFANIYKYDGGRCTGKAKVRDLDMGQYWAGYSCSFNPSITVAVPFGISVAGWPSCGQRTQAGYDPGRYGFSSSHYEQYNSGSPAAFQDFTKEGPIADPPCYGVFATAEIWQGTSNNSFGYNKGATSKKTCL
jgi:hypothetical protein